MNGESSRKQLTISGKGVNIVSMIGELLRKRRLAKGLTQTQLGVLADVSDRAISEFENDYREPSPMLRNKLCNALGLDVETLLPPEPRESITINVTDAFEDRLIELACWTVANAEGSIAREWWHLLTKQAFSPQYNAARRRVAEEGGIHAGYEYATTGKLSARVVTMFREGDFK